NEHARVDVGLLKSRNVGRRNRTNEIETPPRDKQTAAGAAQRKQSAFNQEMPRQLRTACAKRRAHDKFFPPRNSASQLQIRNIRTRDQQDAANCAEQKIKEMAVFADRIFEQKFR